ncbi:dihydrodipicolinate synthase family protein [Pleionea sp. CnH1-48]|uniref:dihydrodipicolinate synthase family protein n=1 Tax=Pleionea sp. CnH1-48 TaxID=2954494 RepID=UPI0020977D8F|nr:dihydrodipicolinate synthase family protein [Pleionea sp. CnH1-48]MCO7223416.1 dihydrodipicolinate synthase family protein [Pleionea sp. CnH1-48]
MQNTWSGVFPAISTQFNSDESLNIDATCNMVEQLIDDGIHGIIALGTVGENYALSATEKLQLLKALKQAINGRVPLLTGVAEITTAAAITYVQEAEAIGVDGLMVLPGLVYHSDQQEAITHFSRVAKATQLPVMIYNNPVSYGVDLGLDSMEQLAEIENIVAIKESTTDTRRISELYSRFGNRFNIFCGVDDIALESLLLGCNGWISGLTNVFPRESVALYNYAQSKQIEAARELYRWFMPLLRLDTIPKLVQCIKLAEQIMGRGSETVRAPRLPLEGAEREQVETLMREALATRPKIQSLKVA